MSRSLPLKKEEAPVAYDVNGAAAVAGFGRQFIYDRMNDGSLPARKFGRRTVIMREDLVSLIASLPAYRPNRVAA